MMKPTQLILIASLGLSVACGGSEKKSNTPAPGTTHSSPSDSDSDADINDVDAPGQDGGNVDGGESTDGGHGTTTQPDKTGPSVTFVLKNSANTPLSLNMDKGWQAVIFSYSGTPPNAKSMLMFPTHCTASCDAAKADRCPYCPAPKRARDIKAAEKHDDVVAGDTREVPWKMMAFDNEKTRGTKNGKKNAQCQCYREVEPEPGTYTIKACGLRKTANAKQRSVYQCVEAQLTLPVTEATRVELDFQ